MGDFFSTKKVKKFSRGNACCQLFATDKWFVRVVPMKSKTDVLLATKKFSKKIRNMDEIITDAAHEKKYQKVNSFAIVPEQH